MLVNTPIQDQIRAQQEIEAEAREAVRTAKKNIKVLIEDLRASDEVRRWEIHVRSLHPFKDLKVGASIYGVEARSVEEALDFAEDGADSYLFFEPRTNPETEETYPRTVYPIITARCALTGEQGSREIRIAPDAPICPCNTPRQHVWVDSYPWLASDDECVCRDCGCAMLLEYSPGPSNTQREYVSYYPGKYREQLGFARLDAIHSKIAELTEHQVCLDHKDMMVTVNFPNGVSDSMVESLQWKIRRALSDGFWVRECRQFDPGEPEKVWLEIRKKGKSDE
jgi:hypothetical protein